MAATGRQIVIYGAAFIAGIFFLFLCLYKAKPFLAPLATAVVLAMLMLPVSRKMEAKGLKRGYASMINTLFLFLVSLGFMALIGLQVQNFIDDWGKAEKKILPQVERLERFVLEETPLEKKDIEKQASGSLENVGKYAMGLFSGFYSFAGDYLLTLIYIFFLLNYRRKFRIFFLKLFPEQRKQEIDTVLNDAVKIASGYLYGKFLLMLFLAVLYGVGMGISGVSNFIIISLLAALLSIIPYIGNIIGFVIALGLGYVADGDTGALLGIIVTFFIVQFIESYFFEPYVVGDQVNLDPFMTILVVVVGSLLWGVIGMILSVPLLGMLNVLFHHVEALQPYAYLLSSDEKKKSKV